MAKDLTARTTLISPLFSLDHTKLKLWYKMGFLFSLALYISQIPFPKNNAGVKSLALAGMAVFWLAKLILERRSNFLRTKLWWPLVTFTAIIVISTIGSIDVGYSLHNIKKYTIVSLFLFFAIVSNVQEPKDIKVLLFALLVSTGFFSILGLVNYLAFEPSFGTRLEFPYLYTNLGRFSKFYDVVIPVNLALLLSTDDKIKKTFLGIIILLSICTILFMQTRGSYVAIFMGLVAITFVYRRKFLIGMLAIPFLFVIMMPTTMATRAQKILKFEDYLKIGGPLNHRPNGWRGGVRIIAENPLFGLGVGKSNFGRVVKNFRDLDYDRDHAHNTYLQIAVETGLIGLAAFLWLFGSVFYHGFKHYLSLPREDEGAILTFGILCGLGGLFVHGLICYFYKHEGFFILWLSVALLFALIEGNNRKLQSEKTSGQRDTRG